MANRPPGPCTAPDFYEHVARVGRALASPERLCLLDLLSHGERSVEVLAETAGQPLRTASHHLQQLKAARLVSCRKDGRFAVYSLADDSVARFWTDLRHFAQDRSLELQAGAAQVDRHRSRGSVITRERAHQALQRRGTTFLDVRPAEEYRAAHLPGALSIPLSELGEKAHTLPKSKPIVAYCRGAHCLLADEAVDLLQRLGFKARRLEDGFTEWKQASLPVEGRARCPD